MQALILVGGKGTRLLPLTCNTPKAMMPVINVPFLVHVLHHLSRHQVKDIVLAQGHLAQPIEGYLGDGSKYGVRLTYIVENSPRGTAGAIKNAEKYLHDRFYVLNGDIFTDLDFTAMLKFHQAAGAEATISLTPVEDPTAFGLIETDAGGRVMRFLEKPKREEVTTNMINAGTYILEHSVLDKIRPDAEVSIEREVFPNLVQQYKSVFAYPSPAYWMDMGTPEKYLQLHRDLLDGRCPEFTTGPGAAWQEHDGAHPTACLKGPVILGSGCSVGAGTRLVGPTVLGEGCRVLEGATIKASVIWRDTWLGPGAKVAGSIISHGCRLEKGSVVESSVLAEGVVIAEGARVETGSKVWPGTRVEGRWDKKA